jgi:hypothetical protein
VSISGRCKPDFVRPTPKRGAVRSFIYPAGAEFPPEWDATYPGSMDGPPDPLFCLAPDWVYHASVVTFGAVSSYLPFSPLPLAIRRKAQGGIFSVTLSVATGFPNAPPFSRGILPFGVRTFLSTIRSSERPHPEIDLSRCNGQASGASGNFGVLSHGRTRSRSSLFRRKSSCSHGTLLP